MMMALVMLIAGVMVMVDGDDDDAKISPTVTKGK